jgi:hypothetical protein
LHLPLVQPFALRNCYSDGAVVSYSLCHLPAALLPVSAALTALQCRGGATHGYERSSGARPHRDHRDAQA